jgi:hypothetical protein
VAAALTSPKTQFGHDVGDDYFLVNYTQHVDYLLKLDRESDRMTVVEIARPRRRPEYTAIITSPRIIEGWRRSLTPTVDPRSPMSSTRNRRDSSHATEGGRLDRWRPARNRSARRAKPFDLIYN